MATPVSLFVYGLLKIRLSTAHTARRRQRSTSGLQPEMQSLYF
jgi:hypothetical protein